MFIIIPIGGIGKRFSDDGYILPKPLINIKGKTMIEWVIDNLVLEEKDKLIITYSSHLDNFRFSDFIRKRYLSSESIYCDSKETKISEKPQIILYRLEEVTKGAAHTLQITLLNLLKDYPIEFNKNKVVSLDCDTFYKEDILSRIRNTDKNSILYFKSVDLKPIYSYIQLDASNNIKDIKEKIKISDNANSGCYCFLNAKNLLTYCNKLISSFQEDKKELYISTIYSEMLENKEEIIGIEIKDFICLGTPLQVKSFIDNSRCNNQRICFDLDNTLVTYPKIDGD